MRQQISERRSDECREIEKPMGFEIFLCRQNVAQRHCVSHEKGLAVGKPLKLVHIVKREGIVCIAITGEILRCG